MRKGSELYNSQKKDPPAVRPAGISLGGNAQGGQQALPGLPAGSVHRGRLNQRRNHPVRKAQGQPRDDDEAAQRGHHAAPA